MYHQYEELARSRHREDVALADRRRRVRALQAHRRATRRQVRANQALAQATLRVATVTA